jgi:hypothetical protein
LPAELLGKAPPAARPLGETLAGAAAAIIPRQGPMPSAAEAGAVSCFESRAAAEPEFGERLRATLETLERLCRDDGAASFVAASDAQRVAALRRLESESAAAFAELRDTVYESYYTNPEIWRLVGYDFRSGPRRTAALPAFDDKLLDRVRRQAARWRPRDA